MTKVVRMTSEQDVGRYMIEVLNLDTNECEQTEYFPWSESLGGDGNQAKAYAEAKFLQLSLADQLKCDQQYR
jgi:hypothetical protein